MKVILYTAAMVGRLLGSLRADTLIPLSAEVTGGYIKKYGDQASYGLTIVVSYL